MKTLKELSDYEERRINNYKTCIVSDKFDELEKEVFTEELLNLQQQHIITEQAIKSQERLNSYMIEMEEHYKANPLSMMTVEEKKGNFEDDDYQAEVDEFNFMENLIEE